MGFLELRRQCGVSHEVRRGAQGASRVAPGKSGLHVRGEGERRGVCVFLNYRASVIAQLVKNLPAVQETGV